MTGGLWKGKLMGQCFTVDFDSTQSVIGGGNTACGHQSFAEAAVPSVQCLPAWNR